VPRIWADTIDTHRRQVNDAILDATAELVAERGPLSVAMSAIAERAGIGRATLYKYFPDVESILVAWHERDFAGHRHRLEALRDADDVTLEDLVDFVREQRQHHPHARGADVLGALAQTLAGADAVAPAIEPEIVGVLAGLLTRLSGRGEVRDDHDPELLARWFLHAAHAPGDLDDDAVAQLLVDSLAPRAGGRRTPRT
jgi:AcrR family transcriptional regulator